MRFAVGKAKQDQFFRPLKLGKRMPVQATCIADPWIKPIKSQHPRTQVTQQRAISFCIVADAVSAIER